MKNYTWYNNIHTLVVDSNDKAVTSKWVPSSITSLEIYLQQIIFFNFILGYLELGLFIAQYVKKKIDLVCISQGSQALLCPCNKHKRYK